MHERVPLGAYMSKLTRVRVLSGLGLLFFILDAPASAQQASGIAGVVRDTTGAVMPGVTVTCASPALIEQERTVFTDGEGRYSLVDLRPGSYSVTFMLAGFSTVRREGIELTSGFTATVNADLRVGALEETLTVSGAAPVVDAQTVRQQKVLSTEVLQSLPTGNAGFGTLVATTAGFSGSVADVGGTRDTWASQGDYRFYHGKPGTRANFDGMRNQHFASGTGAGYVVNNDTVAEFQLETSGMSAEAAGGTTVLNAIPKEGGNTFAYMVNAKLSTSGMQSNNLNDDLRGRGFTTPQQVQNIYKLGATASGPLMRDRAWFFGAIGRWGKEVNIGGAFFNQTQGSMVYTPDLTRPAADFDWYRTHAGRLTWQVSPRNKLSLYGDLQQNCRCTTGFAGANAIESQVGWDNWPAGIVQATWSSPMTSRLLLEAGMSRQVYTWVNFTQPGVSRDDVSILEQSTNFRYNAPTTHQAPLARTGRGMQRFATSYITGSHTVKVGFTNEYAFNETERSRSGPDGVNYTFLRGTPVALDMYALPFHHKEQMNAEVGAFVQDQWNINRLSLNLGIRYDFATFGVPAEDLPAGPFVPARRTQALKGIPRWSDWNPRLGMSYDVFGNGRTAVKASLGRYVELTGSSFTESMHPLTASVNSASRSWTDLDGDFVPDCELRNFAPNGECGRISNQNFGQFNPNATQFDPAITRDNRASTWDLLTELQHELITGLSLSVAYNRNWDRQSTPSVIAAALRVTDNLAVTPSDFSPYCITTPLDPRLPGGGGQQMCGFYNVNPEKFGQVQDFVTLDKKYGKASRVWNGLAVNLNGRLGSRLRVGGGVDTGRQVTDRCFVIDSPQELVNCYLVTNPSGLTQLKLNMSYGLPGDIVIGALYQDAPGPVILADYPASNAEIRPSLGRNLSGGAASASVPLIVPQTQFEKRYTQLDLRLSKTLKLGRARIQGNLDLYNALNSSSILSIVTTYGPRWRRPLSILDARLLQLSGQLSF